MTRDEALRKAKRRCSRNPALAAAARAAWDRVFERISDRASAKRPKPLSFEVRHEEAVAREALLRTIANGGTAESAEADALAAVGLTPDLTFEDMLA